MIYTWFVNSSSQEDFSNIQIVASQMGWAKLLEKKGKDKNRDKEKAPSTTELDLSALPDFTGKRMNLRLNDWTSFSNLCLLFPIAAPHVPWV